MLIHASDAQTMLDAPRGNHAEAGTVGDVQALLDALAEWQVLDRSYDGTRAANLAEYRNRHYVYQFTQAGYRAYRAVEDVLGASLEDAQLSRLVFPDILADLVTLAEAARTGDAAEVYRKLSRLDGVLADMAQRAARFYLMLGDLARTNDTRPEVFLAHKDALLTHMREFHSELSRYSPLLADAVAAVDAVGADRVAALAAEADERLFRTPAERVADWRHRWGGLVQWFGRQRPAARPNGCRTPPSPGSRTSPPCCGGSPSPGAAGSAGRASCATSRSGSPPSRPTPTRTPCSRRCSASARRGTSRRATTTRS